MLFLKNERCAFNDAIFVPIDSGIFFSQFLLHMTISGSTRENFRGIFKKDKKKPAPCEAGSGINLFITIARDSILTVAAH